MHWRCWKKDPLESIWIRNPSYLQRLALFPLEFSPINGVSERSKLVLASSPHPQRPKWADHRCGAQLKGGISCTNLHVKNKTIIDSHPGCFVWKKKRSWWPWKLRQTVHVFAWRNGSFEHSFSTARTTILLEEYFLKEKGKKELGNSFSRSPHRRLLFFTTSLGTPAPAPHRLYSGMRKLSPERLQHQVLTAANDSAMWCIV